MTNFTKVGVSERLVELVITASPTYYFPSLSRLCPKATASGTAFWVVSKHTSVSSVQKLFRSREYLWIPFDIYNIVMWNAHTHTCRRILG